MQIFLILINKLTFLLLAPRGRKTVLFFLSQSNKAFSYMNVMVQYIVPLIFMKSLQDKISKIR